MTRQKTKIIFLLIGLILVMVFVFWAFVSPSSTQNRQSESVDDIPTSQPKSTIEQTPNDPAQTEDLGPEIVDQAKMKGLNGNSASGDVKLVKTDKLYYVRLEDDFSVTAGPDLFVAFGNNGQITELIAPLKGDSGGQNYELPSSFDPEIHTQVFIHCRAFGYSFAVADLAT